MSKTRQTILLAAMLALGVSFAGTEEPEGAWVREAAANRSLGFELELAKGSDFYLVLDTETSRLRLMLRGVVLEEFAVDRLDLGVPERLFVNASGSGEVRDRVWTAGTLDPPNRDERQVIQPPDPKTPEEELEPPTADPPQPAPGRYFIRFSEPLVLEVRSAGSSSSFLGRLYEAGRRRATDAAAVVTGRAAARVRVFLSDDDAELLYQSLPPGTRLLVL